MKRKTPAAKYNAHKFLLALGRNLYSLRIGQKKSLETVAAAMQITPGLLDKIEKGEHDCDLILLFDLCEYYGVGGDGVSVNEGAFPFNLVISTHAEAKRGSGRIS